MRQRAELPARAPFYERLKECFTLHAPRQSGKTTLLMALAQQLTAEGRTCAVLLSLEVGAWAPDDPGAAELAILEYGGERFVVELQRVPPAHRTLEQVRAQGLRQLSGYLQRLGLTEGWLLIFDQRAGRTWEQRLWREEHLQDGQRLHLLGA